MKLKLLVCLLSIFVFRPAVAFASDEGPSSELSVTGITQFTRPALGIGSYGTVPEMQSSKNSFGGSVEYRRWFRSNGFAATYSVVASNAFFKYSSTDEFPLTRHEVNGSFVRRLLPYSRLDPYLTVGLGTFVTHGGLGDWHNGVFIPDGRLGLDCQFELTSGAGLDLWRTRHFGLQTGYVMHWFRAPNFSDPSYHGSRTFITEPQIGFTWSF